MSADQQEVDAEEPRWRFVVLVGERKDEGLVSRWRAETAAEPTKGRQRNKAAKANKEGEALSCLQRAEEQVSTSVECKLGLNCKKGRKKIDQGKAVSRAVDGRHAAADNNRQVPVGVVQRSPRFGSS
jgi:hypothetical protein